MPLIQNPKVIGRDSFARHDIIRKKVTDLQGGCDWCGQTQHVRIKKQGLHTGEVVERLYQYGIELGFASTGRRVSSVLTHVVRLITHKGQNESD